MADDSLDHLLPRKGEIQRVSPWASVQLRFIRDDLAPLIDKGVPIKHLLRLLAPLEITNRRETLRQFVLDEFPEEYARYYAKRGTAERIRREAAPERRSEAPDTAPDVETKEEEERPDIPAASRKTKRLNVGDMLGQVGDFASGKHLETSKGE